MTTARTGKDLLKRYQKNPANYFKSSKKRPNNPRHVPAPRTPIPYFKPKSTTATSKIGIYGKGVHEHILAKQLGAELFTFNNRIPKFETMIFMYPYPYSKLLKIRQLKRLRPNTKIILWWIGTDALHFIQKYRIRKRMRQLKLGRNCIHLAVSEHVKAELLKYGINSRVVTLVPDIDKMHPLPLPKNYTVAVYIPTHRKDFYRWNDIKAIAKLTPKIKYIVYGNRESLKPHPPNIKVLGWVKDTSKVFASCNCLLRLTLHDGFPKSIIEAILYNRCVITNHKYPCVKVLHHNTDIANFIKTEPIITPGAINYYKKNYHPKIMNKKVPI